jgi:hypothetical protein
VSEYLRARICRIERQLDQLNTPAPRPLTPDQEASPMFDYNDQLRLECLRLAVSLALPGFSASEVVEAAGGFYAFATGKDRAAPAEKAKAAIDEAVR